MHFFFSFLIVHVILPPFIFVIIATLTLASFGKSLGIRKIYVKVLLFIFEVKNIFRKLLNFLMAFEGFSKLSSFIIRKQLDLHH